MRLAAIREDRVQDRGPGSGDGGGVPRDAGEADSLFRRAMRAMEARDDEAALRLFDRLCRYEGDAPPGLLASARASRDFLDPDRSSEQKAQTLFDFFRPTVVRVYDADRTSR
jgi:hypothetical protein